MAESFLSTRGCVYKFTYSGSGSGAGLFSISPNFPSGDASSPILIDGIDLTDQDIIFPVVTVENFKVIYTFGSDYGSCRIMGSCLLGAANVAGAGGSFGRVMRYFETNRISKKKAPIMVSMPGSKAYNVYLTGLNVGQPDANFNIQPFAFMGIVANQQ